MLNFCIFVFIMYAIAGKDNMPSNKVTLTREIRGYLGRTEYKITEEEAKIHPDRNIITRAVGILSFVDVDFDIVDVNGNDNILICTDGLNGAVEDIKILEVINEYGENSPEKLIEAAISAGGRDNITAVVLCNQGA